jgi:hypothetical protein
VLHGNSITASGCTWFARLSVCVVTTFRPTLSRSNALCSTALHHQPGPCWFQATCLECLGLQHRTRYKLVQAWRMLANLLLRQPSRGAPSSGGLTRRGSLPSLHSASLLASCWAAGSQNVVCLADGRMWPATSVVAASVQSLLLCAVLYTYLWRGLLTGLVLTPAADCRAARHRHNDHDVTHC